MSGAKQAALVAAAVLLQAGLAVSAMRGSSATFDEGAHLPAGFTHLALGDHRLNPEQPPLAKLLAALPLLAAGVRMQQDDFAWQRARQWEFGRRFLYRWNDADRLLLLGRLPIVALASCLVVAVFCVARARFGLAAALAALLFAALSPDVLAHGALVTTDLAFALFFFLALLAWSRLLARATPLRVLAAGLATGAALATKFSGPLLVPIVGVLAARSVLRDRPLEAALVARRFTARTRGGRLSLVLLLLAAVAAIGLVVLWAAYGFRSALTADPALRAELLSPLATAPGRLGSAASLLARSGLVPEDYARGLAFVAEHSEARPTFLLGELSDHGFPLYFAASFLLKTPVPLLLLGVLALVRARRIPRDDAWLLYLPVAIYLAATATRGLQIGHRHLLPIYPFLFVAAGEAAAALARWHGRAGTALCAVLALWYAGGSLRQHPHHLAYFNELAGGSRNGWRLLVDSNLDWGQDLKRLAAWMREQQVKRVKLSYFGSADPGYYGIEHEDLPGYSAPHPAHVTREIQPGDVVAVSATNLQGVYLDRADDLALMARLRALEPIGRVGWSILVYRADFTWPPTAPAGAEVGP